jgi:putative flavoprotein involved in K+ transport
LNETAVQWLVRKVSPFIQAALGAAADVHGAAHTHSHTLMTRIEHYEAIIIGAGQAGLAAGYWLAKHGIDFLIVDANARVGDVWRNRWDSLQLFTPARYSALPGMAFPGEPYHLPSRIEVADYLEWYARANELPVRLGVRVLSVRRGSDGFCIATDGVQLEAENVIVATGAFQKPVIPAFADQLDPEIFQVHSNEYRNPQQLPRGDVLVVGAANSGAQIALELSRSRGVLLAGRSVGSMPRRILGPPPFDWLWPTLMRPGADSALGRRIRSSILSSTDKLIGMSERDLVSPTLRRVARLTGVRDGIPLLDDERLANVRSVVWCTGFRPDFGWIEAPIFDEDGAPAHVRGVTAIPGLYFLGLRFLHRLNSSLLGGVGADAKYVAGALASRYGQIRGAAPMAHSGRWRATMS